MASQKSIDEALNLIVEEWNKAEAAIKLAEQVNEEIVNPSIYELRYAGRRIVEALNLRKSDPDKAMRLIGDANFDCCRARHDAIDAATSKMSAVLDLSKKKLGAHNVIKHFPDITKLVRMLSSVRKKIVVSREDREDREAIYSVLQDHELKDSVELYEEFKASEELMVAAAESDRRSKVVDRTISIAAIIVAVVIAIYSFLGTPKNPQGSNANNSTTTTKPATP